MYKLILSRSWLSDKGEALLGLCINSTNPQEIFINKQLLLHSNMNKTANEDKINLLKKMIIHSSAEGDVVLDPFAGSGSTCKACGELGRKWLGIELDGRRV